MINFAITYVIIQLSQVCTCYSFKEMWSQGVKGVGFYRKGIRLRSALPLASSKNSLTPFNSLTPNKLRTYET